MFIGEFGDTVDFDPGPNVYNLTAIGGADVFVSKFNSNGQFLWAVSFDAFNEEFGNAIATDIFGNVYLTGRFNGTVDFDPGLGTYNLSPNGIFVLKLDTNGAFIWAKKHR